MGYNYLLITTLTVSIAVVTVLLDYIGLKISNGSNDG